jgi:hypothetical protein
MSPYRPASSRQDRQICAQPAQAELGITYKTAWLLAQKL